MRGTPGADDMVGFAATTPVPLFHKIRRLDSGGSPSVVTGMSICGVSLAYIGTRDAIRPYERECKRCFQTTAWSTIDRTPREPAIRPMLVEPVVPVEPTDLRVTPDGLLGIKSSAGTWVVFDPDQPLMLETADDDAAEDWRTLRSCWHDLKLVNARQLAEKYDVERSVIAKWRNAPNFPRPLAFVGDRPGWVEEALPRIELWVKARRGRTGRPPKDPQ